MRGSEFIITMKDGQESHVYKWEPEEDIKVLGVIQLVHGSCEHAKRYIDFAQFLTDKGYVVYANDLRGHGLSVKRNYTLNRLSYDSFCNQFKPIRTKQDWLSRDEKVVDGFKADEKCGFVFTSSAFRDMFDGLLFITDKNNIIKTPKDLPILLISGDKDPVGSNGKMVNKAYQY
jgi:alpha-beta hydrolase superfamily lysophospholipase